MSGSKGRWRRTMTDASNILWRARMAVSGTAGSAWARAATPAAGSPRRAPAPIPRARSSAGSPGPSCRDRRRARRSRSRAMPTGGWRSSCARATVSSTTVGRGRRARRSADGRRSTGRGRDVRWSSPTPTDGWSSSCSGKIVPCTTTGRSRRTPPSEVGAGIVVRGARGASRLWLAMAQVGWWWPCVTRRGPCRLPRRPYRMATSAPRSPSVAPGLPMVSRPSPRPGMDEWRWSRAARIDTSTAPGRRRRVAGSVPGMAWGTVDG